jgi:50S ribosomal subunit-associated GTPase HflX
MMEQDKIEVWDRIDLILNIFDKHAVSAEAKLQIELAAIKHM